MKFFNKFQIYKSIFLLCLILALSVLFLPAHVFAQSYGSGSYGCGDYGTGSNCASNSQNSNSGGGSSGGGSASSTTCTAQAPMAAPDLFEIDVQGTNATLFIAPPPQPYTNYQISFGNGTNDEGYNVTFPMWNATGALAYTIHYLQPSSHYSFKVRALNNCMPGNWSADLQILSGMTKGTSAKKYFPSQKPVLAYTPNTKVTNTILNPQVSYAPGKPQTYVPTPLPPVKATTKTTATVQSSGSIWDAIKNFFTHLF